MVWTYYILWGTYIDRSFLWTTCKNISFLGTIEFDTSEFTTLTHTARQLPTLDPVILAV
jgi:hypothetical protein